VIPVRVGVVLKDLSYFANRLHQVYHSIETGPVADVKTRAHEFDILVFLAPVSLELSTVMFDAAEQGVKCITVWTGHTTSHPHFKVDLNQLKTYTWKHVCMSDVNRDELRWWHGIKAETRTFPLDYGKFNPTPFPEKPFVAWYALGQWENDVRRALKIVGKAKVPVLHYGDMQMGTWTDDVNEVYQRCSHYLLVVTHSACSGGIIEANLCGRTTVTSYPHPVAGLYSNWDDRLIECIENNYFIDRIKTTRDWIRDQESWASLWGGTEPWPFKDYKWRDEREDRREQD